MVGLNRYQMDILGAKLFNIKYFNVNNNSSSPDILKNPAEI